MLIVDTGPLVAAADSADPDHEVCSALLERHPGPLVTTPIVVTEVAWLIGRDLGAKNEAKFFRALGAGEIDVENLTTDDWNRVAELLIEYDDLGLDAADASIVAIAERLRQEEIATLDHRDFRVVRPRHCDAFELVPSPA